mmetsp:Transcript_19781/g.33287  ORF Transcript_19781/g.33287 Transcript_19781/m.33287 type:complete len:105 (-) Transcript_19781:193-507(-)
MSKEQQQEVQQSVDFIRNRVERYELSATWRYTTTAISTHKCSSVLFRPYERYWNKKYFPKVLQSAGFFLAVVDVVWFVKFDSGLRCDEFNNLINLTYIHMYHFE